MQVQGYSQTRKCGGIDTGDGYRFCGKDKTGWRDGKFPFKVKEPVERICVTIRGLINIVTDVCCKNKEEADESFNKWN